VPVCAGLFFLHFLFKKKVETTEAYGKIKARVFEKNGVNFSLKVK
jgi:hypothetical protein